jgi:hypothetical protein
MKTNGGGGLLAGRDLGAHEVANDGNFVSEHYDGKREHFKISKIGN